MTTIAGLKLNDVVISINDIEFNETPYCDFYAFTREYLRKENMIRLKIKRESKTESIEIVKSELMKAMKSGLNLSPAFGGTMVPQWCRNLPPLVYTPWLGHI